MIGNVGNYPCYLDTRTPLPGHTPDIAHDQQGGGRAVVLVITYMCPESRALASWISMWKVWIVAAVETGFVLIALVVAL